MNFIMFWPKGGCLVYSSTSFPNLLINFSKKFHNTSHMTWTTPSFNCKHPSMCVHTFHQPYGYPPLLVFMATNTLNPWCNLWHNCCHCAKCWIPHGTRTITCASFSYIQLLLLMNQHCTYQKWHSHPNQCCHC